MTRRNFIAKSLKGTTILLIPSTITHETLNTTTMAKIQVQHYRINMLNFAFAASSNGPVSPFDNTFTFQDYYKIVSLSTLLNVAPWSTGVYLQAQQVHCPLTFASVSNYDITLGNPVSSVVNNGGPVVGVSNSGIIVDLAGDTFVKNMDLDYLDYWVTPNAQYRMNIIFLASLQSTIAGNISVALDFGFIKQNPYG